MLKTMFILTILLLGTFRAAAVDVPADTTDPLPFTFHRDDVVAKIGNALPDRMQHEGWLETALQSQLGGLNVRFRNMGFSGDLVDRAPRQKGCMSRDDYLSHVKADVIFAFFGYNESFDGPAKADAYRKGLVKLVQHLRARQPNGTSFPRFVLFSPIAFEETGDPNLPDGSEHNPRLAAYAEATRLAAADAGVAYVDLYTPSLDLFEKSDARLTVNGAHLNEEGHRLLAATVATALFERPVMLGAQQEALRTAVKDKNWHWHNRYRATDGNDIWGSRARLTFMNKQNNGAVLKHEMVMLDSLAANRDRKIWAVSQGQDHVLDDSNVPAPIAVASNIGGGSGSSSAIKEGSPDYLAAAESAKQLTVPEGYAVNVFASEEMFPSLANPVQMQVDGKGRIWAASWNSYPKWEPLTELKDSLMIFEDVDKDGVADKHIVFAKVHNPVGFEFWNGGVLVTAGPDLLFLKDTDGDDRADVRTVVLGGLGTADTHHSANNLTYGPGGGIYWQSGIFLVHNHEHPWGKSLQTGASGMYRFDPRRATIKYHSGGSGPNPHGTSFDYWGYCYANDGTGGRPYQVRPDGQGFKMHSLLNREVRPVAANVIISSPHFPDDIQGDFAMCNTIGFLGLKTYKLHKDGSDKPPKRTGEAWGTRREPLLESKDRNFRPTDAVFGEDGALYVSDWQNVIIGHMQHNVRDPSRDKSHGRIVRVTYPSRPLQKPVAIDGQPILALLENLKHPADGVRHRTRVELSERDSSKVLEAARLWAKDFDPAKEDEAHHLLEALWLHQQHNVRNERLLEKLLASPIEHARIAAGTVKHFWRTVDTATGGTVFIEKKKSKKVAAPKHLSKKDVKSYQAGAEIFSRDAHCSTCHQADGQGLAKVYPPLAGTKWVLGDEERLIKLTLHGLFGDIEVKGVPYSIKTGTPPMTAFGALLNNQEIADVLTYVRNSWGNEAPAIRAETVKRVRIATEGQSMFWKPQALLKAHPFAN